MLFPVAEVRVDRDDGAGVGDASPFPEFRRRRGVRDADHAPPRQHDSEVRRHRFRRHGHVQRDSLASIQAEFVQPVGDPSTQSPQFTVRHLPD